MKKYPDDEIIRMTKNAPNPVREALENVKTAIDIAELGQKHGLHIDQIGTLAELNRNMLLGLVNPQEFLQELIAAGIPDADARRIIAEINQKIFVPLREEMRNGVVETQQRPIPPLPPVQPPQAVPPPVMQRPAPRENVQPLNTVIIPANPRLPSRPPEMYVSMPRYTSPKAATRPAMPKGQKTTDPSRMLEDHEEPHLDISDKMQGASSTPLRVFPPRPPGGFNVKEPPPNLPGALPPDPLTPPPPRPQPPAPAAPYSTDPYREPIG